MSESIEPKRRWGLLAAVVVVGVAADQITKYLAEIHLRGRGLVRVIDGFFEFRYARNPARSSASAPSSTRAFAGSSSWSRASPRPC